jgi:hypothetical protein
MTQVPRLSFVQPLADLAVESCPSITDEFLESYVRWREASEEVRTAHEHWRTCEPHHRRVAFERYRAALDGEDYAARIHCDWTERLRTTERESA